MAESPSPKARALLALDIELRGANVLRNGIMAIGYCLGHADTFKIIERGRICIQPMCIEHRLQSYERRCVAEFWIKHQNVARTLEAEAIAPQKAVQKFYALLQKFSREYDVSIITDFPSCDAGIIDFYLATFRFPSLYYKPLSNIDLCKYQHSVNTEYVALEYHPIYDTDGYARGAMGYGYDRSQIRNVDVAARFGFEIATKASHYPDEDACHVYEVHVKTVLATTRVERTLHSKAILEE